jgi:hypothetical protein
MSHGENRLGLRSPRHAPMRKEHLVEVAADALKADLVTREPIEQWP